MKPECDCLNWCGDDPRLQGGLVRPCSEMVERKKPQPTVREDFESWFTDHGTVGQLKWLPKVERYASESTDWMYRAYKAGAERAR